MIIHSVALSLKPEMSKEERANFFDAAMDLSNIPGVENFQFLKQVSIKNPYHFFISMEFETEALYQAYSNHPQHLHFIEKYWIPFVVAFQEGDFAPFDAKEF
jgi:heme-degrading monooxygenase HmoA